MVTHDARVAVIATFRHDRSPLSTARAKRSKVIAAAALALGLTQACIRDPGSQLWTVAFAQGSAGASATVSPAAGSNNVAGGYATTAPNGGATAGTGGATSTNLGGSYATTALGGATVTSNSLEGGSGAGGVPSSAGGGANGGSIDCDSAPAPLQAAKGFVVDSFDLHTLDDSDTCLDNALPAAASPVSLANLLGYCSTCFTFGGGQIETALTNSAGALRCSGKALKLTYDVNVGFSGYVQWFSGNTVCGVDCKPLQAGSHCGTLDVVVGSCAGFDLDRLEYRYLTFWIKFEFDSGSGPGDVEVALKDVCDQQSDPKVLAIAHGTHEAVSGPWTKVRIGLDALRTNRQQPVDTSQLREVSFTFANAAKYPRHGTAFIDELAFERD